MKKNRIAIIIPYFGKFPEWADLYFYSCAQNSFIDWHIFTDCNYTSKSYSNISIHKISFEDYCKNVSDELKISFNPASAYKLCDLKPFYGFIHRNLLDSYEFWGFADMDIVWGDIAKFYTDELLDRYDVFSTHNDRMSGHLSIIRSNEHYRNLCFKINNWQHKLEDSANYALDEADFSRLIFPKSKNIGKFYRQVMMKTMGWKYSWQTYYTLFPIFHKLFRHKRKRLYFKEQHTTPILNADGRLYKYESDTWFYQKGKIFNDRIDKEYIYFHFMIYKKNSFRRDLFWNENYYHIPQNYDYSHGVEINKQGFFVKK